MNRILFLDDDDQFRRLLVPQLKERGIEVIQARNAAEATAELNSLPFDLLIVDGQLPDMDGATWLKSIRGKGIKTEVLFVSGAWRDSETYHRLIDDLDVALIVHKPLNPRIFIEQILQVLRHSGEPNAMAFRFDADADLQDLAREYVVHLGARLDELAGYIQKIEFLRDGVSLNKAHMLAHNIHGTASTYGFPLVGTFMADVELELESIKAEAACVAPARFASLRALVRRAKTDAQRHRGAANMLPPGALTRGTSAERITKIMLVDDDPFFLRRAQQLLSADGMVITSFTDTTMIGEVIDQVCPDVVILDVNMGGVSGFDVCRFLKANIRWKDVPVVVVSADASQNTHLAALEAGADDFVGKPISNRAFTQTVLAQVQRRDLLLSRLAI